MVCKKCNHLYFTLFITAFAIFKKSTRFYSKKVTKVFDLIKTKSKCNKIGT